MGARGKSGATGATGATGADGARGAAGSLTPDERRKEFTVVHDQIEHIYHELDVQMKRMAQLQAEVDEVRAALRRLIVDSTLSRRDG
jgi:hypothetical protein